MEEREHNRREGPPGGRDPALDSPLHDALVARRSWQGLPTNHLDLESKAQLADELVSTAATLLVSSHDRAFLDRLATRWLWIHQGRLQELSSPPPLYESVLRPQRPANPATRPPTAVRGAPNEAPPVGQEALCARLEVLENLLQADLARKPRFQKPALQRQGRTESAQL